MTRVGIPALLSSSRPAVQISLYFFVLSSVKLPEGYRKIVSLGCVAAMDEEKKNSPLTLLHSKIFDCHFTCDFSCCGYDSNISRIFSYRSTFDLES